MKCSLLAPLAVPGLLLALTACGDDADSDAADGAPADAAASVAASASTEVDVEGMLDSVDDSTLLGALGEGITGVLPGAGSYAVAGSTLTVTMEEGTAEEDGDASCSIAGGAASALGVGPDTMLVLVFPDGDAVCEI